MYKKISLIFVLAFALFLPFFASAHPGNTDSSGCHTCRTNCSSWGLYSGEYHCHQSKGTYQPSEPIHSVWGDSGTGYTTPAPEYSYPSYTYTPTCPSMSSYNSITGKCKCYSGYVVGTDFSGKEACVSADSKCSDLLGYGGKYNSSTEKCECRYGYIYNGKKCVSETTYCMDLLGLMSKYNSLTKQCECMPGYEYSGSSCVFKKSSGITDYSYFFDQLKNNSTNSASNNCPINSYLGTDNKCYCNSGYEANSTLDGCTLSCQKNSTRVSDKCLCNDGFILNNGNCITHTENCKLSFGAYVSGVAGDNNSSCSCLSGYSWNDLRTSCIFDINQVSITEKEKSLTKSVDKNFSKKQAGRIFTQNEEGFLMWYVNPQDNKRYLINSASDLLNAIQKTGKFLEAKQVAIIKKSPGKYIGNFIIDKTNWKYYYVNPKDKKFYEVAPKNNGYDDYEAGYQLLKKLAVGITNLDIRKIAVGSWE
jgi:hypothetical protein